MCPMKLAPRHCSGQIHTSFSCFLMMILLFGARVLSQVTGVAAEGASTIGKNHLMISGGYSTIIPPGMLWADKVINQPGIKVGLGLSDIVDVKFYYSRWAVRGSEYHQNVFQLITKVTGEQHMLALYLPFGLVHSKYKQAYDEDEIGKVWMIAPRMIATLRRKKHFDFCIIPYLEMLKEKSYKPVITMGVNLGIGLFTLSRRFSFRFEGGIDIRTLAEGYPCGTAGVSLNYIIDMTR